MGSSEYELLAEYGEAVAIGAAGLFLGAGLSMPQYPSWTELLSTPMAEAAIPDSLRDLPLAAEYYTQTVGGGRERLHRLMLDRLNRVAPTPHEGHLHISRLPIRDLWTTNYDPLLELALPDAQVVAKEEDLRRPRPVGQRRIVKMHGSLSGSPPTHWVTSPIITRSDFENYAARHPRMWASLRADFLTRPLLFLGFSFADANMDVLLRLARSLQTSTAHWTVLRRPNETEGLEDRLLHQHRVRDLQGSGVNVVEIDDYSELVPLLGRLVRRTRPPQVFVAGRCGSSDNGRRLSEAVGARLAQLRSTPPIRIASLAGPAARFCSYAFARELRAQRLYDPDRIHFYFRQLPCAPDGLDERTGTAIHTDDDQDALRTRVIDESRAMLVVGGAANTRAEVELARELGVPIVPLAETGGTAREVWEEERERPSAQVWEASPSADDDLAHIGGSDHETVANAATRLLARALYIPTG